MKAGNFADLLKARSDFGAALLKEMTAVAKPEAAVRAAGTLVVGRMKQLEARIAALESEKASEIGRIDAAIAEARAEIVSLKGELVRVEQMAGVFAGEKPEPVGKSRGGKATSRKRGA